MSNNIKLIEKRICKKQVYKGNAINFNADKVLTTGNVTSIREYIDHPGAVAVLPLIGKDRIVMVKQYRYPIDEITWEIPAGKMHRGKDSPLFRVKKELKEETGYTAGKIKKLLSFWPCCTFSNEILHIYVATDLKPGKPDPDEDEHVITKIISLKQALKMVKNGKIKDSKTVISILAYSNKGFMK
jgi:ADP-ribose diphosphatase